LTTPSAKNDNSFNKKLTLSKKQLNELKAMLKQPKRKPMRQSKTSKKTLPKLSKK